LSSEIRFFAKPQTVSRQCKKDPATLKADIKNRKFATLTNDKISMAKSLNKNLKKAKNSKNDEFYTELTDIEKELRHYKDHFKGKTVFCNCDDPRISNFFHYFSYNFENLGLKRLITTCYKNQERDLFSNINLKVQFGLNIQVIKMATEFQTQKKLEYIN
jgi:nitrate reductase beta subunit